MDWICYVFKRDGAMYLVADDSLDSAWKQLATRQSMSIDNCKKQYINVGCMCDNDRLWKIKIK